MLNITIPYFRENKYGNTLEYLANSGDAQIFLKLTGRRTMRAGDRELLRDLSGGKISFKEVIAPNYQTKGQ